MPSKPTLDPRVYETKNGVHMLTGKHSPYRCVMVAKHGGMCTQGATWTVADLANHVRIRCCTQHIGAACKFLGVTVAVLPDN